MDDAILDVKKPAMEGIETLRNMKISHPRLEAIMLTGHATVESAIQRVRLGAFDYLIKPCSLKELIGKILFAWGRRERVRS